MRKKNEKVITSEKVLNTDINIFDNDALIDENRVDNELLTISEVNESLNLTQTTQATQTTQTTQATQATQTNFSQNSNISLGLSRTRISHSKCIICNKGGFKKSLKRVKLQLISQYTIRQMNLKCVTLMKEVYHKH